MCPANAWNNGTFAEHSWGNPLANDSLTARESFGFGIFYKRVHDRGMHVLPYAGAGRCWIWKRHRCRGVFSSQHCPRPTISEVGAGSESISASSNTHHMLSWSFRPSDRETDGPDRVAGRGDEVRKGRSNCLIAIAENHA
jgi:hypothetical protein